MPKRERPVWGGPCHFSELKQIAISPAHHKAAVCSPGEPTAALAFGVSVHAVCFDEDYVIFDPPPPLKGARWGREWEKFEATHPDQIIVTRPEYQTACHIKNALKRHALASELLWGADVVGNEQPLNGSLFGVECAGTADVRAVGGIRDLKTTSDARPERFLSGARRLAYHAQIAMYAAMSGIVDPRGHIIAVEKTPPYGVYCYELSHRQLIEGLALVEGWLRKVRQCRESGEWPCYPETIITWGAETEAPNDDDWHEIDGERVSFDYSIEVVS